MIKTTIKVIVNTINPYPIVRYFEVFGYPSRFGTKYRRSPIPTGIPINTRSNKPMNKNSSI